MATGILGRKLGMTQVFDGEGNAIPVTVVEAGPCPVVAVRTEKKNGYTAVQLGFDEMRSATKPIVGHCKRAGVAPQRLLREFRGMDPGQHKVGSTVTVELFSEGDTVDVSGKMKGRGFAGVMKRHNFRGKEATHGSGWHRRPGSIGQAADPSRTFPGVKGPGHMGSVRRTGRNLTVVGVDPERNLLLIKGSVAGHNGGWLEIRKAS